MRTLLTALLILASFTTKAQYTTIVSKSSHSELATKVDKSYIAGMCKLGYSFRIVTNSENQLIYTFTKTTTKYV